MKNILILGAGRSANSLIQYLLNEAVKQDWNIRIGDVSVAFAEEKMKGHPRGAAFKFDVNDAAQCQEEIAKSDLVISMMPAFLHIIVAKKCVELGKHLVTASYVSPAIMELDKEAREKGVLLLNEMGLDPGIDHLSAIKIIHHLQAAGADITLFKSFTGGLVAPESDNNPWNYKFTWNPRNVVLAGQGTAKYIERGQYKYVSYNRLFSATETLHIDGYGDFEGYPNRDSLSYREIYGLKNIPTMIRGTIRKKGFCESWDAFVQLGMTDDTYIVDDSAEMTYREFINAFLPYDEQKSVEEKTAIFLRIPAGSPVMEKLKWLGIFERKAIGMDKATPAQILQKLLEEKWTLAPNDKDMIVMQHKFEYKLKGETKKLTSSMVVIGDDTLDTAMAKTVGLPVAIAVKLILTGKINLSGVLVPVMKEIYEPVLDELEGMGIRFTEHEELVRA